jgi:hypothetical protein
VAIAKAPAADFQPAAAPATVSAAPVNINGNPSRAILMGSGSFRLQLSARWQL